MSAKKKDVSARVRQRVVEEARHRCGYCLRTEELSAHFAWSEDGTEIQGLTQCGRATVAALKLNNPEIVVARRLWVSAGWWPPED